MLNSLDGTVSRSRDGRVTAMLDWVDRDGCSTYDNTAARALFGGWQLFAVLCGIVVEQAELAFTPDASRDVLNPFAGSMRKLKGRGRTLMAPGLMLAWTR